MCIYNARFTAVSPYLTKWVKLTTSQFILVRFSCVSNSDFRYCSAFFRGLNLFALTISGCLLHWWTVFVSSKYHSSIQEDKGIESVVECVSSSSEVLQLKLRYPSLHIIPQRYQCSIYPPPPPPVCRVPLSIRHLDNCYFLYTFGCFSYCDFL